MMNIKPRTISGKLRVRLEEIGLALEGGNTQKSIWEALKKEGYIDCSYTVYANTYKRLTKTYGGDKKTKVDQKEKATKENKQKSKLNNKTSPFIEKPKIDMADFEDDII
jgi:hypothetical protein